MSKTYDQREDLYNAGMFGTNASRAAATTRASEPAPTPTRLANMADIHAMVKKLEAMPKPQWTLIAPDGRVWADADPASLARVAAQHSSFFKIGTP